MRQHRVRSSVVPTQNRDHNRPAADDDTAGSHVPHSAPRIGVDFGRMALVAPQVQREPDEEEREFPPDWQHGAPTRPVIPDPHVAPDPNAPKPMPPDSPYRRPGETSDAESRAHESLPSWVWAVLGGAAAVAVVACFATGVCEFGMLVAGLGYATAMLVIAALKAAGIRDSGSSSA